MVQTVYLAETVFLEQEGDVPKLFFKSWDHEIVQIALVC